MFASISCFVFKVHTYESIFEDAIFMSTFYYFEIGDLGEPWPCYEESIVIK